MATWQQFIYNDAPAMVADMNTRGLTTAQVQEILQATIRGQSVFVVVAFL